jgi:hypothetical protein
MPARRYRQNESTPRKVGRFIEDIKDQLYTIHLTPNEAFDLIKAVVNRVRTNYVLEPQESPSETRTSENEQ